MSYTEGVTSRLPPSDTKQWTHCRHSTSLPFPTVAPTGAACSVSHRQSFNKELKLELTFRVNLPQGALFQDLTVTFKRGPILIVTKIQATLRTS
jgi:hypothetical protein